MAPAKEPPLKDQLVKARERIIAQLDQLNFRARAPEIAPGIKPPDYASIIAELEDELREINALLGTENSPDQ